MRNVWKARLEEMQRREEARRGVLLQIRLSADLCEKVDWAAEFAHRTLSEEIELRLARDFEAEEGGGGSE